LFDTGAVGDPNHQRNDFEHGIARSGLFWTLPVPVSTIHFDTATGQARFHARNVGVKDYHDIINAVGGGGPKPVPSHASFDVRWHGHGRHHKIRDKTFGFEGSYVTGKATIRFTASQDGGGVVYRSDPAGQYNPTTKQGGAGLPAVGQERNGTFLQ
jgi:hypothetical protein